MDSLLQCVELHTQHQNEIPVIQIHGSRFRDQHGRTIMLRGVNLGGSSKVPVRPCGYSHLKEGLISEDISFVGRPFDLCDADSHFSRLSAWGLTFVRFIVTWEAIEHEGPGIYDLEYLEYVRAVLSKAAAYGIQVYVDPHQDVWSRFTGGSGAPGWTLAEVGFDLTKLDETGAAFTHQNFNHPASFPKMLWPTNYFKLACATMFTLFWAGDTYAPKRQAHGQPIQQFLQSHYINAMCQLASYLKDLPNIVGYGTMNEPSVGYIGFSVLDRHLPILRLGPTPTPFQAMALGSGYPTTVPIYERNLKNFVLNKATYKEVMNPNGSSVWRPGYECVWKEHGVWDVDCSTDKPSPVLVKNDYFARDSADNFGQTYFLPFAKAYAKGVRTMSPNAVLFLEMPPSIAPFKYPFPHISPLVIPNIVNASHWYDKMTLFQGTHRPWLNVDGDNKPVFGTASVQKSFRKEMKSFQDESAEMLNGCPTLIGEFGIPFNMNDGVAFSRSNVLLNDFLHRVRGVFDQLKAVRKELVKKTSASINPSLKIKNSSNNIDSTTTTTTTNNNNNNRSVVSDIDNSNDNDDNDDNDDFDEEEDPRDEKCVSEQQHLRHKPTAVSFSGVDTPLTIQVFDADSVRKHSRFLSELSTSHTNSNIFVPPPSTNSNNIWDSHIKALDDSIAALEDTLLHWTIWNYTADNSNRWGDNWNLEDLSIFSCDQQSTEETQALSVNDSQTRLHSSLSQLSTDSPCITAVVDPRFPIGATQSRNPSVLSKYSYSFTYASPTTTTGVGKHSPLVSFQSHTNLPVLLSISALPATSIYRSSFSISMPYQVVFDGQRQSLEISLTSPAGRFFNSRSGGRALDALIRPYARIVAGTPIKMRFELKTRIFVLQFEEDEDWDPSLSQSAVNCNNNRHDDDIKHEEKKNNNTDDDDDDDVVNNNINQCCDDSYPLTNVSVLYIPFILHYPHGYDIKISDGTIHCIDNQNGTHTVYYTHTRSSSDLFNPALIQKHKDSICGRPYRDQPSIVKQQTPAIHSLCITPRKANKSKLKFRPSFASAPRRNSSCIIA